MTIIRGLLAPHGERFSPVGLDIGASRLKAVQLKWTRGAVSLYSATAACVPGSALQDGRISDLETVTALVRRLRVRQGWRRRRVNLCIDPLACYTQKITLSHLQAGDEEEMLSRTARELFPFLGSDPVFDYCVLHRDHPGQSMSRQYLLAAADPAVVAGYTTAIAAAGCYPGLLEVRPLAQLRSLTSRLPRDRDGNRCLALLDIGFSGATLLVAVGQNLPYWRSLKTGIKHFCRLFFHAGRTGFQEACRDLYSTDKTGREKIAGLSALLAGEVQRIIDYLLEGDHGAAGEPDLLLLCGGGSAIPGLPRLLEEQLELPVRVYNPLPEPQNFGPVVKGNQLFAAAHGLALKGWLE